MHKVITEKTPIKILCRNRD